MINKVIISGKIKESPTIVFPKELMVAKFCIESEDKNEKFECFAISKSALKISKFDVKPDQEILIFGRLMKYEWKDINFARRTTNFILVYDFELFSESREEWNTISEKMRNDLFQDTQRYIKDGYSPILLRNEYGG